MFRRLTLAISSLAVVFCLLPAAPVAAGAFNPFEGACNSGASAANSAACKTDGSDPITGKNGILYKTSRILALVSGVAAVIIIMIGGFMHVTAAGDAARAKTGRSMIIGALVGLVVIALSELAITIFINIVN